MKPRRFEVDLGDIILFYDSRFPPDPGTGTSEVSAVNRVAIVVNEKYALFIGRNRLGLKCVERFLLGQALTEGQNFQILKSQFGSSNDRIVDFFLNSERQPNEFEAGIKALSCGNLPLLFAGALFPTPRTYKSEDEYEETWKRLKRNLLPLDTVFTRDNKNALSRFIAWSTHGPWSHVAIHVAEGEIWESITSGIRSTSIDVYRGRRFRVAVYRHIDSLNKPVSPERAREIVSSHRFRPNRYNYFQAIRFGTKSFLGDHSHALVPNSQIYQGIYVPIAEA